MFRLCLAICLLNLMLSACTLPSELATPIPNAAEVSAGSEGSVESAEESDTPANSINIVESAQLLETTEIRVLQITVGEQPSYELVAVISDEAEITAVVESLNQPLPLVPGLRCPDAYAIEFVGEDDQAKELRYFCPEEPAYLRGDAVSPEGNAVEAPDAFAQLIGDAIQSSGE